MNSLKYKFRIYFLLSILAITLFSCKEDDEIEPDDEEEVIVSPNVAINNWIQAVMNEVYYWLDDMRSPIAVSSEPSDYFESLLFEPTDRFSIIYPNFQELRNSLSGVSTEAGYEFSLIRESLDNQNVLAPVTYIKKGSPADIEGLKRGDILTQINGTTMTLGNYQSLLRSISSNHSVTFRRFDEGNNTYAAGQSINLTTTLIEENPNFLDTIYTVDNQKIGYFIYNFFSPGVEDSEGEVDTRYDQEMDEVFANFKAEGINHLIVDFRYNGGGFVSSSVNLASLIAPNITSTSVFSKTKFNSFLSRFSQFQNVQTNFKVKSQNIGNLLSENKIFVITSTRTASASELVINSLRPYMEVVIIGDVTNGKNVGSVLFEDEDNPDNNYGLLPIISKSFNSLDQSDYGNGFNPDFNINELDFINLIDLGNLNEPLLKATMDRVLNRPPTGRRSKIEREHISSSLDRKIRQGLLLEDSKSVKEAFEKIK
ncbi:S41 family peptidase [Belliella sp. DSM 107340]|uniref:S41 family peptidase n=1 Tax=Belliella calami TaxID=2923436 RepID=A0ABS9UK39_9BACT|nr:S41 family peptidase [Belliella calami]MCH7396942.1 S41 family peptidase [Belliella calami]